MSTSIYNTVSGLGKKAQYASWPKPFNYMERLDVLNCNEFFMLRAQFFAPIAAEFWWDANVPSPKELFRNWVFGQLRCGSKMGVRTRLPGLFDFFFDSKGRVALAQIAGPIGGGLFYWAMAQSAFTALATWSTLANIAAMCEEPEAHCIMRDGHVFEKLPGDGAVPFYEEVYDPMDVGEPLDGTMILGPTNAMAWATGRLTSTWAGGTVEIDMWIGVEGVAPDNVQHFSVGPLGTVQFSVGRASAIGGVFQVRFHNYTTIPGVLPHIEIYATRFFGTTGPPTDPNRDMLNLWEPFPTPGQCELRFADGTPLPP